MRKRRRFLVRYGLLLFLISGILIIAATSSTKTNTQRRSLWRVSLFLNNVTFDEYASNSKTTKYYGNEVIVSDSDDHEILFTDVVVRGRGNSTWGEPKKPFRITLPRKANLFNLGFAKKWALLANNLDNSLIRNDVAMYMGELLQFGVILKGVFVELFVNNVDMGVYYITKTPEIEKDIIDIKDDYGLLVEVDDIYCDGDIKAISKNGDCLVLKDAVNDDIASVAFEKFVGRYNELERALEEGDYEKVQEIIDVESFAKYFLISELTNNPDAYSTSWWMHQDGIDKKIVAGPIWDYDFALGNKKWGEPKYVDDFYDPKIPTIRMVHAMGEEEQRDESVSKIMYQLLEIKDFRDVVNNYYKEKLMNKKDDVIAYIHEQVDYLKEAAVADTKMWNKDSFEDEIDYLIWWIENRFQMMDAEYGGKTLFLVKEVEI